MSETEGRPEQESPEQPKRSFLEKFRREPTEEEKAESERRWKAIQVGRHPDTNRPLRWGDEKSLRPEEQIYVQSERDMNMLRYGTPYPSALDRMMEAEKRHQQMIDAATGGPERRAMEEAMRLVQPAWMEAEKAMRLADPARHQVETFMLQHKDAVDAALGTYRDVRAHLDTFEQHRRYVDPLMDQAFVHRMVPDVDNDLVRRAAELADADAMRHLREQVDASAITRITSGWAEWERHAGGLAATKTFVTDASLMVGEAQRMLAVYGPTIAEQPSFLTEYRANLALFQGFGFAEAAMERADLLSRLALPTGLVTGFDGSDPATVTRVRRYRELELIELEEDFKREGNPVFIWQAIAIARRYGIELPEWVLEYLAASADSLLDIREEVADGKRAGKEAERVGKVLGFGTDGPGQGGWFKHATILERDRNVFFEIGDRLGAGMKLDFAYDEVARALGTSRSTVVRAYLRIKALSSEDDDEVS